MNEAKAAVSEFLHKSGHHDTTVHETTARAVTHEVVKPTVHEEVVQAVDREVHHDHYHTSVQPILAREILPEKHKHKAGEVEHRSFDHARKEEDRLRHEAELAAFENERKIAETKYTESVAPTVGGEHVHHHVHEAIQPVIEKETIQPTIVHTTHRIHEVHHDAHHHTASSLPPVTLEEFEAQGGHLGGRATEKRDHFEGQPKDIDATLGALGTEAAIGHHGHHHHSGLGGNTGSTGVGIGSTGVGMTAADRQLQREGGIGSGHHHHSGLGNNNTSSIGTGGGLGSTGTGLNATDRELNRQGGVGSGSLGGRGTGTGIGGTDRDLNRQAGLGSGSLGGGRV